VDRLTDEQLLALARAERRAFAEFYRRHAIAVHDWFARTATQDASTLDDLTAETFAQALVSLGRFRARGDGSASAWLFAIANNQRRQFHRRRRISETARRALGIALETEDEAFELGEERLLAEELRPHLLTALGLLPADQRRAIELRVFQEANYRVISTTLGCTEQAARVRVFRGLRALRASLMS
jgi:RNA polymerase sigma-70 factor (ECF subfamily)